MVVDVKTDQKFTKSKFLEMTLGISCYFKILFRMTCLCNSIDFDDHLRLSLRIIASIEVYELFLTNLSNFDSKKLQLFSNWQFEQCKSPYLKGEYAEIQRVELRTSQGVGQVSRYILKFNIWIMKLRYTEW